MLWQPAGASLQPRRPVATGCVGAARMHNARVHVLFVEVDTEREWAVASLGPAFIAAYLRAHGHRVSFQRARLGTPAEVVAARIDEQGADLVGLSLTTRQWQRARGIARELRSRSEIPVVAGGLHPTFSACEVLAEPGFDFACLGEGEQPTLDLVEALAAGAPTEGIANVWTRGGRRPSLRPPFTPVDALPFAARDLLDEHPGVVHVSTQRGCPFPCTYCGARMYNQLYEGTGEYGRRRSHRNVLDELSGLRAQDRLAYVIFLDDTFTIHHPWVKEFCRLYTDEVGAPFCLHARVETVNAELLALLARAGCRQITYGVESGSERVRRQVMRRPVTNQRFRDVFRWTREAGIAVTANYMLGVPGETRDDLRRTLELAEELAVLDFGYFVFYPYPGTQLFELCRERGYLPADYLEREANHRESILELPDLTRDDIAEFYARFTALHRHLTLARVAAPGSAADAVGHVAELARTG